MDQRDLVTLSLAGGLRLPYGPLPGAAKTPLGRDQVNVLFLSFTREIGAKFGDVVGTGEIEYVFETECVGAQPESKHQKP
jgi:hypothetical protein